MIRKHKGNMSKRIVNTLLDLRLSMVEIPDTYILFTSLTLL